MRKQTVLFLCTDNAARSQMAEALLRNHAGDVFDIYSAGITPGQVDPIAIQVLDEAGVPTDGLRCKGTQEFMGRMPIRYLIIVCPVAYAACPAMWPGVSERLHWRLDEPLSADAGEEDRFERFQEIRDQIDKRIMAWLDELRSKGIIPELAAH